MGPDEEDARNNSPTASVTKPELAGDLEMTTTQAQSDAAPQSAVVDEKIEDEVVRGMAADGNQAANSTREEEDKAVVDNVPDGGSGVEGGGQISGEEKQLAVKESEAAEDAGGGRVVSALLETNEEVLVEAADVEREVAVTSVTDGDADTQVLEECDVTAVQDGDDVGEKPVAEDTVDSREQGADDMSKKADLAELMELGEESDTAVAAEVSDSAAHGATEEVRVGNSEDDCKAVVAEVATTRDDNEEEMAEVAEDMKVINEETDAAEKIDGMEEMEKVDELSRSSGGQKRKRGGTKGVQKVAPKKMVEEDVCFICFDGGDLVLCDRRKCPKAYHPSCVDRDEAFFRTKGQWFCGWHLCSKCGKNAYYMCYTCTFSLCNNCVKDSVIFCVRGKKGFCESCITIVKLIEDSLKGDKDMVQVDFDDRSSWEYLFKDYYIELKENLSLTLGEISQAKNPWRGSGGKQESLDDDDKKSDSENSSEKFEKTAPKRRQTRRQTKSRTKERNLRVDRTDSDSYTEWASKELLEFVMHMNNGEKTALSQFNVQALLLKYITENKLRDPRRRGQVICDERLEKLFGKHRVGHFEMLKLLETHFVAKEDPDGQQATAVDTDEDADVSEKVSKDKKHKIRKRGVARARQANLEEFAAIDTHNINLIYLRRNLLENLIEDAETFNDKVVGSFVRIRIPGSNQNQELYRLVPVIGTSKTAEPYEVGKRTTDILLEILNLNKKELLSIAVVSNQEFTEEECKRLQQSIKFGLINRLTVGDVHEKAMALQAARVKDWLESETIRLGHLRDRASDFGRRKDLRECVEKLQLLKTPEERQRRLEEIPEVHSDPKMDPSNDSDDDEADEYDKRQEAYVGSRGIRREPISPRKGGSYGSWSGSRSQSQELARNSSGKGYSTDTVGSESSWNNAKDRETGQERTNPNNTGSGTMSGPEVRAVPETKAAPVSVEPAIDFSNSDKIWHYQDPTGKIQGPFSMNQLQKWNSTGYFPAELRIWKTTEKQDESVLLKDALNGNFQKDPNRNQAAASGTEVKLTALNLQSLVQYVRNQTDLMAGLVPVPAQQPQIQGQWGSGGTARETQTGNSGFSAPVQVPAGVSPVPSWVQPQSGNQGMWRGDQKSNQSRDGYRGDRSRGSGGGGGGYSRTPAGMCRFFFENGHCKKGSSCNYRHS